MTKKWIAITLLLFVTAGLLGWWLNDSVMRFNAENDLSRIQPVRDIKPKIVQDKSLLQSAPSVNRTPAEFAAVPENNVFSESRTREGMTDGDASLEPPPLTQKPVLVGVSIINNQKRASIIDLANPAQGRTRRSQTKQIGDVYRGYTITEITPNHIVLESGTRKEIIPLHEGSKRQQGGKTPILSTRVVSIGGGAVTGGMPVAVVGTSPVSGRPATAPTSAFGPANTPQPAVSMPAAVPQRTPPTNVTPTQQMQMQAPNQQMQMQAPTTETDAQGRRIIRTPFGNIVRPNRE